MDDREFLARARLDTEVLETWIAAGWLLVGPESGERQFTELDLARAELIHDLKGDIGVNDEGIGVILDLLDKLHGVRRTLDLILSAIRAEPDDVRGRLVVSAEAVMRHRQIGPAGPRSADADQAWDDNR